MHQVCGYVGTSRSMSSLTGQVTPFGMATSKFFSAAFLGVFRFTWEHHQRHSLSTRVIAAQCYAFNASISGPHVSLIASDDPGENTGPHQSTVGLRGRQGSPKKVDSRLGACEVKAGSWTLVLCAVHIY